MKNHEEAVKQPTSETKIENTGLSEEELDEVFGGIIVIGGKPAFTRQQIISTSLNPQPLPPGIKEPKNLGLLGNL